MSWKKAQQHFFERGIEGGVETGVHIKSGVGGSQVQPRESTGLWVPRHSEDQGASAADDSMLHGGQWVYLVSLESTGPNSRAC